MKKTILLLAVAFGLGLSAQAQEQPTAQVLLQPSGEAYEYITVKADFKHRIKGWNAWMKDYKQPEAEGLPLNDESGEMRKFNSPYDVMNYLGSQGWEFAAFTPDLNGAFTWENFLMKRKKIKA